MNPLVSILIPVHNGEKYLAQALQSAIEQSYDHTEIVIVDDGSKDNSVAIIKGFEDERIRFVESQEPHGIGHAWNRCIENSRGEYFCILHQDDSLHPDYVKKMLAHMEAHKPTILYCQASIIDQNNRHRSSFFNAVKYAISKKHHRLELKNMASLFKYDLIMCPTVFYDRKKMIGVGLFSTKLKTALDYDMWFRVVLDGGVIQYVSERLYNYRYHAGMDSQGMRDDLTKHHEDFELKKQVRLLAAKKGVCFSVWTLKRTMVVILIKDALLDFIKLRMRNCLDKLLFCVRVLGKRVSS